MAQGPKFIEDLGKRDPEFLESVKSVMDKAQGPGALDPKTKVLITLAIDAAGGHAGGVKNLSNIARLLGATDKEINEVIRLAFLGSGIPGLVAGLAAYEE